MTTMLRWIIPKPLISTYRAIRYPKRAARLFIERYGPELGLNIARQDDYYSPLPTRSVLKANFARWVKPSTLVEVRYDLEAFKATLSRLMSAYYDEFVHLTPYNEAINIGFGPGYTELDAMTLYCMLRDRKPRRYFEVGSGLSTYYCSLAAAHNAEEGHPMRIECIEPYPHKQLHSLPGIKVHVKEVQDVDPVFFEDLEAGDVLFIDSSHILRLDGDVSYLYLEVMPRVKPGVLIHIHDVPFPFNIPYPAYYWVIDREKYWNEAMLLQAFLCFNHSFDIVLSAPLLRYYDEAFLRQHVPLYKPVSETPNTFSAIWIERVR